MPEIPINWKSIVVKILESLGLGEYVSLVDWGKLEAIVYSCRIMQLECRAIELAAKLLTDIVCEHPLPDGNKRLALLFVLTLILPEIRDRLAADEQSKSMALNVLLDVAQHCADDIESAREKIMTWLTDLVSQCEHRTHSAANQDRAIRG